MNNPWMRVMLTCNEKDILIIPAYRCETMVYEVQKQVDKLAREQGKPYGKLVSTRRLDDKDGTQIDLYSLVDQPQETEYDV